MQKKYNPFLISIIAVVLGVSIGFLVVWLSGRDPMGMVTALVRAMTGYNLSKPGDEIKLIYVFNWILDSMPIILTGLSVAFAFRTGLFNIGAEGQYIMGAAAASMTALLIDLPQVLHAIVCIIAAAIAGALWGFVPGFLKARKKINEVVICIMMNYIAIECSNLLVKNLLPVDENTRARTISFPESAELGKLTDTTSQLNWGIIAVILCVILFYIIIEKTTFGYSLRATGFNKEASRFAGMKVERNVVLSMMISGAFAGIAGAIVILGQFHHGRYFTGFDNHGFTGISVALIGAANALGVALAGLLFGLLQSSGNNLQLFDIPKEISELIQASIIFIIAIQYGIVMVLNKIRKKEKPKIEVKEESA